jgi:glycosyltransferase involved in cell wall biosynthesis
VMSIRYSVIIPCHNAPRLLERTLAGLIAAARRSAHRLEVILVDNNSRGHAVFDIHTRYADQLEIFLISQPRLRHPFALSRARNAGLRCARGAWIVCLDADCIPVSSYFEVLDGVLSSESSRLLTGPRIFVQAEGLRPDAIIEDASVLSRLPRVASASNYGLPVDRRSRWLGRIDRVEHPWALFHGCNMVFRRDCALAAGGFDEGYDGTWGFEDQDFAWRLIAQQDCRPEAIDALRVYHQEPDRDLPQPDRSSRTGNPNWARICNRIPGFEAFKRGQYEEIGVALGDHAEAAVGSCQP